MKDFDPNSAATAGSGIYGLPYGEKESSLVYLPVPWEATTSYGAGTSGGPKAILEASHQLDLFDLDVERPWAAGLHMKSISQQVIAWNKKAKSLVRKGAKNKKTIEEVNLISNRVNTWVREHSQSILDSGKILALIGGDHSTPYGALQAIAQKHDSFGILHFDAHFDLRKAYQGFVHSHASIMRNVLESIPQVKKMVHVGIRDFCEEELEYARRQSSRDETFFDAELHRRLIGGESWSKIADQIVSKLPEKVWVSFDIDGLDPRFCPATGTPVPGGLDYVQALHVLEKLARSGRVIVGFDLNEVGTGEWDANVGMRLLYKMSAYTLASQGKCNWRRST